MSSGITTLIRKVVGSTNPTEYHPITVSSVVGRLFHCVLGNRFEPQRGFKKGDGLYFNSKLLQKALEVAKKYKNLRVAFVDVKKAFDSVSHNLLWVACRRLGVPEHLVHYIQRYYKASNTRLRWCRHKKSLLFISRRTNE